MKNNDFYDDIAPYRKKAKHKPKKKVDHKHNFMPCVYNITHKYGELVDGNRYVPSIKPTIGTYCDICGKIGDVLFLNLPISKMKWKFDVNRWIEEISCEKELKNKKVCRYRERVFTKEALKELNPETRTLPTFEINNYLKQKFVVLD